MKVTRISKSLVEKYLQCPNLCYLSYEKGFYSSSEAIDVGRVVHRSLELYRQSITSPIITAFDQARQEKEFGAISFFSFAKAKRLLEDYQYADISGRKIIELERKYEVVLSNGVPVSAIIDRIDEIDNDTIEIIDYKTSAEIIDEDEMHTDIQCLLYVLIAKIVLPQYKRIKITIEGIQGGRSSTEFNTTELEAFETYILGLWNTINADTEHRQTTNVFCKSCPIFLNCEEVKNKINSIKDISVIYDLHPDNIKDLANKYKRLSTIIRIADGMREEMSKVLNGYLVKAGTDPVVLGDIKIYTATKKFTEYPVDQLATKIPIEDLIKIVVVKKKLLDELLKTKPELSQEINSVAQHGVKNNGIRADKIKSIEK